MPQIVKDPRRARIGIFGGSFNPPHLFHLLAAIYALEASDADEVWLMPVFKHALGKQVAPFKDRMALAAALIHPYRPRLSVSDFEAREGATGYTIDTLRDLVKYYPDNSFFFIAGTDIRNERDKWKDFDAIEQEFGIFWIGRHGHADDDMGAALPDISSSMLRQMLMEGKSPTEYIPQRVLDEIRLRGLYQGESA